MNGAIWIKRTIKEKLQQLFPRKVKTNVITPQGLRSKTIYNALGVTKKANHYYLIIEDNNDKLLWGAEHFNMEEL